MTAQDTIGRYHIIETLGSGGFATVFRAHDNSLDRDVALKVLHPALLVDRGFVERFFREARTVARLRHPGIVTIHEVGEASGRAFLAMELAATNLAAHLASHGPLPWADVLGLLRSICEALDYAHQHGVVHRDLKPANILLTEDGRPLLSDFGFARLVSQSSASMSVSGGILGTPGYIAPEVWDQSSPEPPADRYSLACIAYELLTGEVLFKGATPIQTMRAHDHGPRFPERWPPGVPAGVSEVLARALSREPERRYERAMAFWEALSQLSARTSQPTAPPAAARPKIRKAPDQPVPGRQSAAPAPRARTRGLAIKPWMIAAGTLALLGVVGILFKYVVQPPPTTPPPPSPVVVVTTTPDPRARGGPELAAALQGAYRGTRVAFDGYVAELEAAHLNATFKPFEDLTGIDIEYIGNKESETAIAQRVAAGIPPDIADFSQPALLAGFVKAGKIVNLTQVLNQGWLKENYKQDWLDMAQMEGPNGPIQAGIWWRAGVKSLVWYPKAAFDQAGYKPPQTWAEMLQLMDAMVARGDTPWCIGIESGAATGWPATDWVEEIMLRTTPLDHYDRWTKGELPFTSIDVEHAVSVMSDIWFQDRYVYGGRGSIVSTSFIDAPAPLFTQPEPKCWLHKQGNFVVTFFPPGAVAGRDYDFFYLPPIDERYGRPVLVTGDIVAMFNDRPEVRAVMQYLTFGESLQGWVAQGGTISPHQDTPLDWYGTPVEREVAQILRDATAIRFDGSDLMPAAVGTGTFWKGMTDYVSGTADLDQAMEQIQQGWENVK